MTIPHKLTRSESSASDRVGPHPSRGGSSPSRGLDMYPDTCTAPAPFAARGVDGLALLGKSPLALRGIRLADGETGAAGSAPAPTPGTPQPAPAAPAGTTPPPAPAGTDPAVAALAAKQAGYTAEQTAAYIKDLRTQAATERTEKEAATTRATEAEKQRDAVLAALGLTADGKPAPKSADELASTLAAKEAAAAETARENLVLRVAPSAGVDPAKIDALLDSKEFSRKLSAIEPTDREGVETLLKEAVQKNPSLAPAPAGASSSGGGQHQGTVPTSARKSMADAVAARLK